MGAHITSALLQASEQAKLRGEHEHAREFANAAARYATFWASGMPQMIQVANQPAPRKPKRRPRAQTKRQASIANHAATLRRQKENQACSAFLGVAALVCLITLAWSLFPHLFHVNESATLRVHNPPIEGRTPNAHVQDISPRS
jgi:hypothetical protein